MIPRLMRCTDPMKSTTTIVLPQPLGPSSREDHMEEYPSGPDHREARLVGRIDQDYFWNTIRFFSSHQTEPCLPKAVLRRSVLSISMVNPSASNFCCQNAQLCSLM